MAEDEKGRIDWPATLAGAAAAVTVAVLLSSLGAAGTLIGAALGSVIATVSTALYKQGIESSRRRMAALQAAALHKVGQADDDLRRARHGADWEALGDIARARESLGEASEALADGAVDGPADDTVESGEATSEVSPAPNGSAAESAEAAEVGADSDLRSRWRALPWRHIAVVAAGVFLVAMLVITALELIAGRSVSSITGGTTDDRRTSVGEVFGDDGSQDKGDDRGPADDPSGSSTPTPSDSATPSTSETPSTTPSETPSSPTGSTTVPTETVTVTVPPSTSIASDGVPATP